MKLFERSLGTSLSTYYQSKGAELSIVTLHAHENVRLAPMDKNSNVSRSSASENTLFCEELMLSLIALNKVGRDESVERSPCVLKPFKHPQISYSSLCYNNMPYRCN